MVPDDCLLRTMASSTTTSSRPATKMEAAPLPPGGEEEEEADPPQNNKDPHRSQQPSPDNSNSDDAPPPPNNNSSTNSSSLGGDVDGGDGVVEVDSSQSASPSSVLLRIPLAKPDTNCEQSPDDSSKCVVIVQNGPDKASEHKQQDESVVTVKEEAVVSSVKEDSAVSSRRASYIDVVGLSGDELTTTTTSTTSNNISVSVSANGTASPATVAPPTDSTSSSSTVTTTSVPAPTPAAGEATAAVFSTEDTEDKDMSEDEDKLVIHEGGVERRTEEEDEEVIALVKQEDNKEVKAVLAKEEGGKEVTPVEVVKEVKEEESARGGNKRPAEQVDSSEQPKKKARCSAADDTTTLDAACTPSQAQVVLAQVNRDLQVLDQQLRQKEQEWDELLRSKLAKQALAERLRRKTQVLRLQAGEEEAEPLPLPTGGLLAALTRGNNNNSSATTTDNDTISPLQMMSRLLSSGRAQTTEQQSSSRSNASSPSISIIDINTRTSSPAPLLTSSAVPDSSLATSHSSNRYGSVTGLTEPLKSKLSRQLMAGKPILPKPQPGNGSPATLAGMLASNGSAVPATGYGPQGPTISVQQLIAAHRKDNPSAPPVKGAKRGAWRQKYDGGKRGGRNDAAAAGLAHLDPNLSYNDMLLQFAQLTQQQQQQQQHGSEKVAGPGSPQISIIPVSDSTGSGSPYNVSSPHPPNSALTLSGGLSVTPAPSTKHNTPSPILEGTSALAKLLMESRAGNKQSALIQQQQQQLQQAAAGAGVTNSQYLTLSALLSGGSTTTVRDKANAMVAAVHQVKNDALMAAAAHQNNDERTKKTTNSGGPDGANNPKCQGCHKVRAQFVCAGCGNQWYCSRECQVAAWDEHSVLCNT